MSFLNLTASQYTHLGIKGSFKVDSKYLKSGNIINLANINYSSSNNKYLYLVSGGVCDVTDKNGVIIGTLYANQSSANKFVLSVDINKDSSSVGTATFNFATASDKFVFNWQTPKSTFTPVRSGNIIYNEKVALTDDSNNSLANYSINISRDNYQALSALPASHMAEGSYNTFGILADYNYRHIVPTTSFTKLQSSKGQQGTVNQQKIYKFYYQVTGENLDQIASMTPNIGIQFFPVNSDGQLVNEEIHLAHDASELGNIVCLDTSSKNGLSLSAIDTLMDNDGRFTNGGFAYSAQYDGNKLVGYNVVFHVPATEFKLTDDDYQSLADSSETITFANDKQALINKTKEYYNGVLKGLPIGTTVGINFNYKFNSSTGKPYSSVPKCQIKLEKS